MATTRVWTGDFDTIVKGLLPSWMNLNDPIRGLTYKFVDELVDGKYQKLAKAVVDAIEDGDVTGAEVRVLLVAGARTLSTGAHAVLDEPAVRSLLQRLEAGSLTTKELGHLAAMWAAERTTNENVRNLLLAAAGVQLAEDPIETAIRDWLKREGKEGLAAALQTLMDDDDGEPTLPSIVALVAGYLVQRRVIEKTETAKAKWVGSIVNALKELKGEDLVTIIEAIVGGDEVTAAYELAKALGMTADRQTIEAILKGDISQFAGGELREAALKKLVKVITENVEGLEGDDATKLAEAIVDIVTGDRDLFPDEDERQRVRLTGPRAIQYPIWKRVRKVLYAAKLAVQGGSLVPPDAQARPHVFSAAALDFDAPLKSLVAEDEHDQALFCSLVVSFAAVEFRAENPAMTAPIDLKALRRGATAGAVHNSVWVAVR